MMEEELNDCRTIQKSSLFIIILVLIVLACQNLFAQSPGKPVRSKKQTSTVEWNKTVLRTIYIYDTASYYSHDIREIVKATDTTLAGILTSMVLAGQLRAYKMNEGQLTDTLSKDYPNQYMKLKFFSFYLVCRYRLIEEWAYDPISLSTKIKIRAIAPILTEYDEDGFYRGERAMFWLRFNDVKNIIAEYEMMHHSKQITRSILRNYTIGTYSPQSN